VRFGTQSVAAVCFHWKDAMPNVEPSQLMALDRGIFETTWSVSNLDAIDREIARLATICGVQLFDAAVLDRLLHNDASICAASNL
jgi:hypothetical protein